MLALSKYMLASEYNSSKNVVITESTLCWNHFMRICPLNIARFIDSVRCGTGWIILVHSATLPGRLGTKS